MKAWWDRLNPRERILTGASGFIVLIVLAYLWVWEPFQARHHRLRQSVAEQRSDLAFMREAAQEIQRLSGVARLASDGRSLLTLVDQTARTAGMGAALKQMAPQGEDRLSARLDAVEFDKLLPWLGALEREHPVVLVNVSVDRTEAAGLVNARIIVQSRRP